MIKLIKNSITDLMLGGLSFYLAFSITRRPLLSLIIITFIAIFKEFIYKYRIKNKTNLSISNILYILAGALIVKLLLLL